MENTDRIYDHGAVTRVLHTMAIDGWANESAGHVDAPGGWFAYIVNDPRDADALVDAFADELGDEHVTTDDVTGAWMLYVDSYGNRDAVRYDNAASVRAAYHALDVECAALYGLDESDIDVEGC